MNNSTNNKPFSKNIYEGTISTDTGFSGPGTIAAAEEASRKKIIAHRDEMMTNIGTVDSEIKQITTELQILNQKFNQINERIKLYEEEEKENNEEIDTDLNLSSIAESANNTNALTSCDALQAQNST